MCKKRRIKRSFGMGEKKQLRVKNIAFMGCCVLAGYNL